MKYIVRCKKTLYHNTVSNKFEDNRGKLSKDLVYVDLFNNLVLLIAKREQIAVVETDDDAKCKLSVLSGPSYRVSLDVVREHFEPIYIEDTCFETRQKLLKKGIH